MTSLALHHPTDLGLRSTSPFRPAVAGIGLRPSKPLLRGRLHQACALASVPAGAHLVSLAGPGHRTAALAYALSWTAMFTTSAAYHRLAHTRPAARRLRRADHSMIFVHIGGAATALALLSLAPLVAALVLAATWSAVLGGIALKLTRLTEGASAGSWMYGVLGGSQALCLPLVTLTLSPAQLVLLVASGVVYAVGAVLFFHKRPDPLPLVFGYHEVWHCFTVVGGCCQYLLLTQLVAA